MKDSPLPPLPSPLFSHYLLFQVRGGDGRGVKQARPHTKCGGRKTPKRNDKKKMGSRLLSTGTWATKKIEFHERMRLVTRNSDSGFSCQKRGQAKRDLGACTVWAGRPLPLGPAFTLAFPNGSASGLSMVRRWEK